MKSKKTYDRHKEYQEYLEYEEYTPKQSRLEKRRPVKDWKRAWEEHQKDYDEFEDFYGK